MARFPQIALLTLLVACGQWEDQNKARDVARELLECFDVEVERTEAHRFHAEGCDRHADIVCSEGALEPVCIRVRERTAGGEVESDDLAEEDVAEEEAAATDATLVPDGYSIEEVEPDPDADDEATDDDRGAIRAASSGAAETAIRRGLDARAEDVMACVDRDRVTVRATFHADGAVVLALTGDLAGSPEEGCVRSAIGDVRVPAGESGVVLHLLHRSAPAPEAPPAEPVAPGTSAPETT